MNDTKAKRRVLILTDVSTLSSDHGEPEDTQSLVRLMLYTNQLEVEGLIATYTSHGGQVHPEYIHAVINGYAQVQENLRHRDAAYPDAAQLHAVVKAGVPACGLEHMGRGKDTEGSRWIVQCAERSSTAPLWILIWGGALDLAQALWTINETHTAQEAANIRSNLRIYAIGDQYDQSGPWIRAQYPNLFYITSRISFRGMYRGGDESLCAPAWVRQHVLRGALGKLYPVYDGGDPWGHVEGMKEGDSPSLLYLIDPHGDPENPESEHWGGRFVRQGMHFFDLPDQSEARDSVAKWRKAYQEDFARRIGWCEQSV